MKITRAIIFLSIAAYAAPAFADQPLAADRSVKGRLEKGDGGRPGNWTDTYVYKGEAGEELFILVVPAREFSSDKGHLSIAGPHGFARRSSYWKEQLNIRLPERGSYSVNVTGSGDYELSLARVRPGQTGGQLTAGQTVQGSFTTTDPGDPEVPGWRQDI